MLTSQYQVWLLLTTVLLACSLTVRLTASHRFVFNAYPLPQSPQVVIQQPDPTFFHVKVLLDTYKDYCRILQSGETYPLRSSNADVLWHEGVTVDEYPAITVEGGFHSQDRIYDVVGEYEKLVWDKVSEVCQGKSIIDDTITALSTDDQDEELLSKDEVIPIVTSGDPKNRIDVVFMGDGYTTKERQKFIDDIKRLTDEMFVDVTFKSWLPLFNIWAVFRPSVDSGITIPGQPKDTAFGLYREGTELRAIYTSKPNAARAICRKMGLACDFPSLIANDDYYGGLGGEFVISTSSETSGTIVLRHEMGHNFIHVGEEYDGGYVYDGVNSARSLNPLKWEHWLTDKSKKVQRNALRVQEYAWWDLDKGPYTIRFKSDGTFSRWLLKLSASGVEQPDSLQVYLDGELLSWKTNGLLDRSFYYWYGHEGFTKGSHVLEFRQAFPANRTSPLRQLCSVTLHEYGDEEEYQFDDSYVGIYPTFDIRNALSYRPTNEGCLMRNMTHRHFCSVCKEGMWLRFLKRISLIDNVTMSCNSDKSSQISLKTLPLAHFRPTPYQIPSEKLNVKWFKHNQEMRELRDKFDVDLDEGVWKVQVRFETEEVRKDVEGLLVDERRLEVRRCGNKWDV